ncbi:MAG: hypothetical protein J5486_04305 [Bacteroidaceae bacterium]|nr:hypothetical protein [Bacteroidaceae bacterium]
MIALVCWNLVAKSQDVSLASWADRLTRFGTAIPQEKVYLHMDNTSYFLGDTIWFAAYTRRTDKDLPSNISRVLYVELLNNDGYLVERQLIEMKNGRGYGNIALSDTSLYGGFYELRAYTRWQLNWGVTEHPHTSNAEQWFFTRGLAKEYYRDYDKLYSRVFPVYDRPNNAGEYFHDMMLRPLRREMKEDPDADKPVLSCYPEGGRLVAGAQCHVAFEATTQDGVWLEGQLIIYDDNNQSVATALVENRGRGSVAFTPQARHSYKAVFTSSDSIYAGTSDVRLADIPENGVALHVSRQDTLWNIHIQPRGLAASRNLGMTIMHEGVVRKFQSAQSCVIPASELKTGVNQLTVFDSTGCVWADRLFFVNSDNYVSRLTVSGLQDTYDPYAPIQLDLNADNLSNATLSIAVRNATLQDYTYDSGNILTEMLLASEIRGFVPQPEWFFQSDDAQHQRALDLLMMTQGWRRFNWLTMATPKAFTLSHPAEYTQVITGTVYRYEGTAKEDITRQQVEADHEAFMTSDIGDNGLQGIEGTSDYAQAQDEGSFSNDDVFAEVVASSKQDIVPRGSQRITGSMARDRYYENMGNLRHEVLVHAEFTQPGSGAIEGDVTTKNGNFRINTPNIGGYCVFFLAASDTTKWKADSHHIWVSGDEEAYPEYYVRLSFPYPRFVKPYTFHQSHIAAAPQGAGQQDDFAWASADAAKAHTIQEVQVSGRRRGLRRFDITKPALIRDAYVAFNDVSDAGFMTAYYNGHTQFVQSIARNYIGDMNLERNYNLEVRYDGRNSTFNHTPQSINAYNNLYNLDRIYIYTDYIPRLEGNKAYSQDNQPSVTVNLQRNEGGGERMTYRDRRYILPGFTSPDQFYSPDYSQHQPPAPSDHRRTLYWNPALQLDSDGSAHIEFYNGSRTATLSVTAEGQAPNGSLITN